MAELNEVVIELVKDGTFTVVASIQEAESGEFFKQADISSISYSIEKYSPEGLGTYSAVANHTNITVPTTCLFDTRVKDDLCSDTMTSGYNFRHVVDVSTHSAFTDRNATYFVTYSFFPIVGQVTKFQVKVSVK